MDVIKEMKPRWRFHEFNRYDRSKFSRIFYTNSSTNEFFTILKFLKTMIRRL